MTDNGQESTASAAPVIPAAYAVPFALVTTLFALWGFANDITNPMVKAFKNVLLLSNSESTLVQTAFYGGYCVMAIPAALFVHRFGYKRGVLLGLALYAGGCLLFLPAAGTMSFAPFLLAYFVMTSGLSFLETTANPYILAMGPSATAARRLNFAQAFNPMGSLAGMFVARDLILARLDDTGEGARRTLADSDPEALAAIQQSDLSIITGPYLVLGVVVLLVLGLFLVVRLPAGESDQQGDQRLQATIARLFRNYRYLGGVIAQTFYVGAQITCWTFIIQYGVNELGMPAAEAQSYNIVGMVIFVSSRFVCTYLLKFFNAGALLGGLAVAGGLLILGAMLLTGKPGLWCLIGVSACMSLMFPTIYGIALEGLGDDAKIGSAGLICAIGGGSALPLLQAWIMDGEPWTAGGASLSATRASFVVPLVCFVVIAFYGLAVFFSGRRASERSGAAAS
ncbi:MAG: L-fucose:H+ symporter permease [Planctomycetota bacterium]